MVMQMVSNLDSDLTPIEDSIVYGKSYHILITAVSPEERSYISVNNILKACSVQKCILTTFTDLLNDIKKENSLKKWFTLELDDWDGIALSSWENNRKRIKELLKEKNIETKEIQKYSMDIRGVIKEIQQNTHGENEILFDISSFPKCYILEILRWISSDIVTIVYTRGKEHESNPERHSVGVKTVSTLPGFEGKFRTRTDLLVLLLGFEGYRSLALLNWYEPYRVLACIGDTEGADRETYIKIAEKNNKLLLDHHMVYEGLIPSLKNPVDISKKLDNVISTFLNTLEESSKEKYNVYLSPLGTKIQTVGLFLYWLNHKDNQIVYAFPTKRRIGTESVYRTYGLVVNKEHK